MLIYIVCICLYVYTTIHQLRASAFIENSKFLLLFLIVIAYLKNSFFGILCHILCEKGKTWSFWTKKLRIYQFLIEA